MCGIVGIYHRDHRPVSSSALLRMTDALAHRGPDGSGTWSESGIGFGHRRLSIRDLSAAGAQPFHSACGRIVAVYNGEIYNDQELAEELERKYGFVRRTTCDTEILPAGWLAWGCGLFDRLEGIYALALWDRDKQQLVLARDAVGVKPLYFADDGLTLRFGSEVKAILADPAFSTTIAPQDVASLLATGHVAPDRTLLADVQQVAPGTVRTIDRNGSVRRFWTPKRNANDRSLAGARDRFLTIFRQVVSDQLVSDVPVAVLQSSGIDSSLISLALPATADVRLYSVRFGEREFDESELTGKLARAVGRPVEFLNLSTSEVEEDFRHVVRAVDGSLADSSALATYRLARSIRTVAPVALSGDGSDELFAGYPTYRATALSALLGRALPRSAWARLAKFFAKHGGFANARMGSAEALTRLCLGLSLDVPHTGWRTYLNPWDRALVYGPELRALHEQDPLGPYACAFREAQGDAWDRGLVADQRHYLPADMLMKVDRTSMAHGLEVRVPFLDRRIMSFAATLDRTLLATFGGQTKRVLRAAAREIGAPRSITRARKRGFNVPMNGLLREGLRPLADRLLGRDADILAPFCAQDGVRRIWREHREGRIDRRYVVWTLLTLAVAREQMGI